MMAQQKNGNVALCPECEGLIKLSGKLKIGQKLTCRRCGSALIVYDRKPLELVLANSSHPAAGPAKSTNKRRDTSEDLFSGMDGSESEEGLDMSTLTDVSVANCPECSATLRFHRPLKERQLVVCPECNETLEVVSLRPLQFHWANEDPWENEEYDNPRNRSRYGFR
jgi:lysine biosynthesis protein LysW